MELSEALDAFTALSQITRLQVFQLLVRHEPDGLAAGDIASAVGVPANTLSAHLAILTRAGLTTSERRSRSIVYRARTIHVSRLVDFLVKDCCGGNPELCRVPHPLSQSSLSKDDAMPDRPYNVLFLCTGNSARSIIAEAILNHDGAGRFRAFSAGSHPTGKVNPIALELLAEDGFSIEGLRSKSWDEFAEPGAPEMDFVFTVCDNAAGETCPVWPGHPMTAHWGIEDPARVVGTHIQQKTAFVTAARYLKNRITNFLALPIRSLDRLAITSHLHEIGRLDGATAKAGETK
ncbi:metalloregulator ArsR/SmtB family transcription factor [Pleomorphomonas koreensis]|uniref:metalloregulator ArsR/SmtB family transcription factor n=1 Tax=Pleomorphomonas koreensis TaxID=257440 RepID=UPI00041483BF|nr:metalloregulator ArsR/SmtB family transcription factor [Pleomorphomonas koreensis]